MELLIKVIAVIMPIVGVIVGATVQSYYSKRSERKKQALTFKSQSYVDYLKCFAESARIKNLDQKEIDSLFSRAADAKTRISIFGSSNVVNALGKFVEKGENLKTHESNSAFVQLCLAMRSDFLDEESMPSVNATVGILLGEDNSGRA